MGTDEAANNNDLPLSALPSPFARAFAFISIIIGGGLGGVTGYALVKVQCSGSCSIQKGLGVLLGSVTFAVGMSIVAVLGLRAIGEWRETQDQIGN